MAGCASLKQEAPAAIPDMPRLYHEHIELAGRFSVHYQRDGEENAMHGRFKWVQLGAHTELTLLSPLGQIMAKLKMAPEVTVLTMSDKDVRVAADPDALVMEALGWPLPVSGMRGWLQGCALDENGQQFTATPNHSYVITQNGWRLAYPLWDQSVPKMIRPKRIDLQHQAGEDDVSVRLVIDVWQPAVYE